MSAKNKTSHLHTKLITIIWSRTTWQNMGHPMTYFTWVILKIALPGQELGKKYCWKMCAISSLNNSYKNFFLNQTQANSFPSFSSTTNIILTIQSCIKKSILRFFTIFMKRKNTFSTKGSKLFLTLMMKEIVKAKTQWMKIFR